MTEDQKEKALDYLNKTKRDAMKFYADACQEAAEWEQIIEDCDAQIEDVSLMGEPKGAMYRKLLIALVIVHVLVFVSIMLSCCTVKGVMNDSAWILRTTADNIQVQEK